MAIELLLWIAGYSLISFLAGFCYAIIDLLLSKRSQEREQDPILEQIIQLPLVSPVWLGYLLVRKVFHTPILRFG